VPYVRTVKTKSCATAVQVVWSSQRGSRKIEHLGSAHDEAELEMVKAAGRQRIAAGQAELDLGLEPAGGGPLPITSSRMGCLLDALERGYRVLGLDAVAGGDGVFRDLVLARIIEPVSKLDSLRVLEEAGVAPASYRTAGRRLPAYAREEWRQRLSEACAAHVRLGPASLVLYDVSTLYFETDQGDGFRDAGMISEANQKAIEAEGLSFILGMKVPDVPYLVDKWRREHPGEEIPDGHVFAQPWPAGPSSKRRDQWIYYQYRADRARRALRGIDEQVAKAAKAVAGLAPVKRNRFIALDGATKSVNRELEAKARTLAGIKGYVTNLATCPDGTPVTGDFVIGSYHELRNVEKSFRMAKSDLQARPIYHRKRDSIEAHLTIVFAALAVSRWIEHQTGWSIRKFVKTARRYRTIQIQAGQHTVTAADPIPDDLRHALNAINAPAEVRTNLS
jgi:hypothetical protein